MSPRHAHLRILSPRLGDGSHKRDSVIQTKNSILEVNPVIRADLEQIAATKLPWEKLHKKAVLVTGGSGFLAAYLIKSLLAIGRIHGLDINVICVARSMRSVKDRLLPYLNEPNLSIMLHDVSLPTPIDFPHADVVIHSASQASPKYYGTDPVGTLMANTMGTMYSLDQAVKCCAEKYLFFSSGEVYGIPVDANKAVSELDYGYIDPMDVRSCYAESKRLGETMCASWAKQYELHTIVVRPFHTYGPGMALDDGRVFADFVADVVAKRDIVLKSDGLAKRPFCYIADATVGFLTVLLNGCKGQAYNVANPNAEISIKDLAKLIANLFPERAIANKYMLPLNSGGYLKSPIPRSCPSICKMKDLGWEPGVGLEDGFRRTIQSFL